MLEQWKRKKSMENALIAINMVIWPMNAKKNQNLRESVTNLRNKDTRHENGKPQDSI